MMNWSPDFGETLQIRKTVSFASGYAPVVSGRRSFRDSRRNDIQGELPGWPAGPAFELHTPGEQKADKVIGGFLRAIPIVANILTEIGGQGTPYQIPESAGQPEEPENEVEDFPVIWADPGTVARTLPWQLDPARRPQHLKTELAFTDRRLLILAGDGEPDGPADVLWEVPRAVIRTARHMKFSEHHTDLKIVFTDGSWTRLQSGFALKLGQYLRGDVRVVTEAEMTEGQRAGSRRWVADLPAEALAPTFTLMPSGILLAEARVRRKKQIGTTAMYIGQDGEQAKPQPDDLK